jgi:hypothetical protein
MDNSVTQFLASGILLAAFCFVIQRTFRLTKQKNYAGAILWIASLICIIAAWAAFQFINAPPRTLGKESWYQSPPIADGLLFLTMLLGMAASYLTKQVEKRRARIEEKKKLGDNSGTGLDFDLWEFTYPMFVSVITFGAILQSVGDKALDIQALILSFQTGFFWQTVLERSRGAELAR